MQANSTPGTRFFDNAPAYSWSSRGRTLILLAHGDGLRWDQRFDEAAVERSPFVAAFLAYFPR
jgi:hypothetical protein